MAERAVGDHRDAVSLAPGDHRVLDGSLLEVVEDLVAREAALPGDLAGLLQVGHVEVAHAPGEDLPSLAWSCSKAAKVSSSGYSPRQCRR